MRNVTSMDFQEKHPELVAVSYRESNSVTATNSELDGVVAVWNMEFPGDTPEYAHFHTFTIENKLFQISLHLTVASYLLQIRALSS